MLTRNSASWLLLLLTLLLPHSAAAQAPPPGRDSMAYADLLARWGAYADAERAYNTLLKTATDPAQRLTLQLRRLALAEIWEDQARTDNLADNIARMPGVDASTEAQMQIALARGTVAWRAGQVSSARQQFDRALEQASRLDTPAAHLARFECQTFKYFERLAQEGRPSTADYETAFKTAYAPLMNYPLTQPLEPLVEMRAAQWGRRWMRGAMYYANVTYAADPDVARAWYHTTEDLANGGRNVLHARAVQAGDPESGYGALEMGIDMAEGFSAVPTLATPWLTTAETEATNGDTILAKMEAWLGSKPTWTEQKWVRGRIHRARAEVLAAQCGYQGGTELGAQAIREANAAIEAFDDCGRRLDSIDTQIELGAFEPSADRASAQLNEALKSSRSLSYPVGVMQATYWIGKRLADAGRLPEAETALRECVTQTDTLIDAWSPGAEGRRQTTQNLRLIYELLIDVLRRQHKDDEALQMLSRMQQQTQLASVDLSRVEARNPAVREALAKAGELQAKQHDLQLRANVQPEVQLAQEHANSLKGEIASNRAQFFQALNTIHQLEPDYDRLVSVRPTSYARLQPHLPTDLLLLQYLPAADKLYVFIVTREALKIKVVDAPRTQLEHDVSLLRRAVSEVPRSNGDGLSEAARAAAARLYDQLIAPAAEELQQKSMLAVVPSGSLYYVPFAVLGPTSGAGIDYLARHKAVAMLSSLEILDLLDAQKQPHKDRLFAIGNPDGSLPGAQEEVKDLAALFVDPVIYTQQAATKETLSHLSHDTSIVHFATHGMLNPEDANESYLVMAGAGDHGKLKAAEIYGLDFKGVSLVTLSACKTALSWSQPGADVATLAQAFSVAGTHSMLASLWSVSDTETRMLMLDFYKNLLAGKSKAQALQLAQQALLSRPDTAAPFYWAAFELIGDWR
jgi:CHAT domain-containing protein